MTYSSTVHLDGTITITARHFTKTRRYSRQVGPPKEGYGRVYDHEYVETAWTGDLTVTIDPAKVLDELDKALSNKSRKAIEMSGAVVARATNVKATTTVLETSK